MAFPCTCLATKEPINYIAELAKAEAVFHGTVRDIVSIGPFDDDLTNKLVVMDVKAAWKGVRHHRIYVFTGSGGGDCGYPFLLGKEYIVWANRVGPFAPGELSTSICDHTALLGWAGQQLDQLPNPVPIPEGPNE